MKNFITLIAILVFTAFSAQAQNPFGNGSDGVLTVNEGETLTINTERTTVSGNNFAGAFSILVDSTGGIQIGDEVLIITMQDPETDMNDNRVGKWEVHYVAGTSSGELSLQSALRQEFNAEDGKKHQVVRIPQYTDVDILGTLTCPGWDGNTGGILYFRSNSTVTISATGIVTSTGKGYRGGIQFGDTYGGGQGGESFVGVGGDGGHYTADPHGKVGAGGGGAAYNGYNGGNGIAGGGGGATGGSVGLGSANLGGAGGGGGGYTGSAGGAGYGSFGFGGYSYGNSNNGQDGGENLSGNGGSKGEGGGGGGGGTYGSADLAKLYLGSGGGCGGRHSPYNPGFGGNGGGLLYISCNSIDCEGNIESDGGIGGNGGSNSGGGGGAAGGSVYLEAVNIDNSTAISSFGGNGGVGNYGNAGNGGEGRIRLNTNNLVNTGTISPNHFQGQFYNIIHTPLSNTNDLSGPYQVSALALDNEGDLISEAKLFYRINGGPFNEIAMTEIGSTQEFTGNIPGQTINTEIDYYLTATDGTDNYIMPLNAPAELYAFEVTTFPPYGLGVTDNNDGTVEINWYEPLDLTNFVDYSIYRSEQDGFTPGAFNLLADNISDTTYLDNTVIDFHTYYYLVSANYDYSGTLNESFSGQSEALLVNNTGQTTVLGYAYLEAQNNHANIKINFIPESPSAVADSIYTNALGYFETHDIIPGVYSVRYEKPGYQTTYVLEVITIIEDTDLDETTIYDMGTTVSGNVSGEWDEFISVSGDITIPENDTLVINQGTIVRFLGDYHFYVYGYLACNGAEGDTILMTSARANQNQAAGQWKGIDFYDASDNNSYLHYTIVRYAYDGIDMDYASPTIENCLIHNCSNSGIYADNYSHPYIFASVIDNTKNGIYVYHYCNPLIEGCTILNNAENGIYFNYGYNTNGTIINNVIKNNTIGIHLHYYGSPLIENNLICDNSSHGIYIIRYSNPRIYNNQILRNNYGVFIYDYLNDPIISYNMIAYNFNDGISLNDYSSQLNIPIITYNTIYANSGDGIEIGSNFNGDETINNNLISNNNDFGIRSDAYIEACENNDIYSNTSGEISNLGNLPPETWNFISINPNTNTICDIYRNITEEPGFVFSDTLDFTLQELSPCINGGSESVIDPDGSISDIGALYFDFGCPHEVYATAYADQTVSLAWDEVANDSIVEYNVYYKISETEPDYTLFGSTPDTAIDVTGLTNNVLYDFTVTGAYPNYESIYAPKVSEQPGVPEMIYDPGSYCLIIPAGEDSIVEDFTLTNNGSRDLDINFSGRNSNKAYAYFDGNGDYASYGDHDHLDGMSALTMECWLYRENEGYFDFMGKNYRNYQFAINSGENVYFYKGYGNPQSNSHQGWSTGYHINTNQWYHLAITWEGNTITLYVNGEHVWTATDAQTGPIPDFHNYSFDLGRRGGENSNYLQGRMAEARLWNVARNQEDIQENMYQSLFGNEEGLIGYWPLHDDFDDQSLYGVSATVYGETHLENDSNAPFVLFTLPQTEYTLAPDATEIIPLTFYNREDMSSIFFTTSLFTNDFDEPEVGIEVALQFGESVPSTPVHFIPVPETGLPYTIVIKNAEIDGQVIDVGDEIGVFDGDVCVGAGIFDGTFNFIITAWEGDPGQGLTGFTAGNEMIFKMYDTSADLETNEADEVYFIGDDTFGYGTFSALSLEASVYNIQNVAFTGGQFNLISFNLLPHYPDASEIFAGIDGLEIVYIDNGGVFIPGYNINTIGDINFLDGFYLYGDNSSSIAYEGTFIHEEDWDITVEPAKWNYISVLSQSPIAVTDVFAGLENEVSILQAASGDSWIPSEAINTIGNMQPGLGYKIALAVDTSVTFNYPAAAKKSGSINVFAEAKPAASRESSYFQPVVTGLPYAVVIKIKSPNESIYNLIPGDEIGLFDAGLCVGSAVYEGGDQLMITAWQQDEAQNLPGFNPGNPIEAKIYRTTQQQFFPQKLLNFDGSLPIYNDGNYGHVILEIVSVNAEAAFFTVAPNPFKNSTEVIIELSAEDRIDVKVFDRSGRLVKVLHEESINAGYHQIIWDGTDLTGQKLNPGVYFIIAETSAKVFTEKVIILQ